MVMIRGEDDTTASLIEFAEQIVNADRYGEANYPMPSPERMQAMHLLHMARVEALLEKILEALDTSSDPVRVRKTTRERPPEGDLTP